MTGAAVLRAGCTRAGLAQRQGARGWARSPSSSVRPRIPLAAPAPAPAPPGVLAIPGATTKAPGKGGDLWKLWGAGVNSRGWRVRRPSRASRRRRPGAALGLWSVHLGGCTAASGRIRTGRGQTYTLVGPLVLLPCSLCSYLSLRSCLFWMQIYAAKSECGGLKPDPLDAGRGWHR